MIPGSFPLSWNEPHHAANTLVGYQLRHSQSVSRMDFNRYDLGAFFGRPRAGNSENDPSMWITGNGINSYAELLTSSQIHPGRIFTVSTFFITALSSLSTHTSEFYYNYSAGAKFTAPKHLPVLSEISV